MAICWSNCKQVSWLALPQPKPNETPQPAAQQGTQPKPTDLGSGAVDWGGGQGASFGYGGSWVVVCLCKNICVGGGGMGDDDDERWWWR